tara:strand:- start:1400 stop:1678 length:279 start_codon:yes stop_codon:yes gene_type:complete
MKKKRHIPVISFNELELKKKKPQVYKSLVEGISEAFKNKTDEIKLCEVKYANTYLTVHKDSWSGSLAKAMDYYIEKEEYEMCSQIKILLKQL